MNRLLIWLMERQIKGGWLPREFFYASARLFGEACLELYIFRLTPDGREQVYLIPRPDDDPFYPSEYHLPGARKIPNELDCDHLRRALAETPFMALSDCVEYAATVTIKAKRGTEYADIRRLNVPYELRVDGFYDVDHLPRNTMKHHIELIKLVRQ
jgi:hypothetical protein